MISPPGCTWFRDGGESAGGDQPVVRRPGRVPAGTVTGEHQRRAAAVADQGRAGGSGQGRVVFDRGDLPRA